MKYLTLIRHAKSGRDAAQVRDHDRELAERGIHDCPVMARRLAATLPVPDRIVCSSARRAVQTMDLLLEHLDSQNNQYPEREIEETLYLADAVDIHRIAQTLLEEHDDVWICAHNPGITEAVNFYTNSHFANVPTLGVVRFSCAEDPMDCEVVFFDTPKNLR